MSPAKAKELGLKTLSFVHYNDLHGHYKPRNYNGRFLSPLSLIRGYFDQVKAENPNSLFCNAGDDMEKGSLVDLISRGEGTIEINQHLGLDLRAVGNHDFAYGRDSLKRFLEVPGGVVLCSNHAIGAKNYHQFEMDGVRVGVFSMVGRPWNELNQQYDGPYFQGFACRYDFTAVANELIHKYRRGVDLLFMLSHLGLSIDEQIAAETEGLDFIIGGHSHTVLETPMRSANGTLIVQAGAYGNFVGRLDIMVEAKSRRISGFHYVLTPVSPAGMNPDLALETRIVDVCQRYAPKADAPITNLPHQLSKLEVAKLASEAAISVFGVDAAVIDVDTVWRELPAGPVSRQDLLDAFSVEIQPPGTHGFNSMMTGTLKVSDWRIIERMAGHSFVVSSRPGPKGSQPVVAHGN